MFDSFDRPMHCLNVLNDLNGFNPLIPKRRRPT
jgi:hypothetical protein